MMQDGPEVEEYPAATKWSEVQAEARAALEFLEFLNSKGYQLMTYVVGHDFPRSVHRSGQSMVCEWLGVDEQQLEIDRRAMLDKMRSANAPEEG